MEEIVIRVACGCLGALLGAWLATWSYIMTTIDKDKELKALRGKLAKIRATVSEP